MKNVKFIYIVLIAFCLFSYTNLKASDGIKFIKNDWEKAKALAKKENKPIFVDVYATWCGPCKKLSNETFTDEEVGEFFNSDFINLKIDGDADESQAFLQKYPIDAYPTLFFISPQGEVIKNKTGFIEAADLLVIADIVLHPENDPIFKLQKTISTGVFSKKELFEYIILGAKDDELDCSAEAETYLAYYTPEDLIKNDSVFVAFYIYDDDYMSGYNQYLAKEHDQLLYIWEDYVSKKVYKVLERNIERIAMKQDKKELKKLKSYVSLWVPKEDKKEVFGLLDSCFEEYSN
ncbi:thioredoxin family protein [Labilibacter marinus]|uniref:thioredoxin family protein n=1 Tax=Labilibacter marinus TaxID=1477105 RepID=UPI00094FB6C7|nr:thioredoxin family protein [Labilibacter marinus]